MAAPAEHPRPIENSYVVPGTLLVAIDFSPSSLRALDAVFNDYVEAHAHCAVHSRLHDPALARRGHGAVLSRVRGSGGAEVPGDP